MQRFPSIRRMGSFNRNQRKYRRRKHDLNLSRMTSSEIIELEKSVSTTSFRERILPFIPVATWMSWIFIGSLFYGFYDGFSWSKALYMSVNVGWSMGWSMQWEYDLNAGNMIFSTFHTSVGVIFIGIAVIYIAQEVGKNKDTWIMQMMKKKDLAAAAETEGYMDDVIAFFRFYMPKLKIFFVFVLWFVLGMIWYSISVSSISNVWVLFDFVISMLSGGGYLAIGDGSSDVQFVITSLYTSIGVPLMSIALGLVLSLVMEAPEDKSIYDKIVASVTPEEIEFMKIFEIDDGDGTIDSKEFIILTVVRIGAAPPQLINQIHARFNILDRKHTGKIKYDDIVFGRHKKLSKQSSFEKKLKGMMRGVSSKRLDVDSSGQRKQLPMEQLNAKLYRIKRNNSSGKFPLVKQRSSRISPSCSTAKSDDGDEGSKPLSRPQLPSENSFVDIENQYDADDCIGSSTQVNDSNVSIVKKGVSFTTTEAFDDRSALASKSTMEVRQRSTSIHDEINEVRQRSRSQSQRARLNSDEESASAVARESSSIRSIQSFDEDKEGRRESEDRGRGDESSELQGAVRAPWLQMRTLPNIFSSQSSQQLPAKSSSQSNLEDPSAKPARGRNAILQTAARSLVLKSSPSQPHSFNEIAQAVSNRDNFDKLKKAKESMEWKQKQKEEADDRSAVILSSQQAWQSLVQNAYFGCFIAWFLWLSCGTLFYTLHEDVSVLTGLYMSVSVGYGIFWVSVTGDAIGRVFTTLHFIVGIFAIALAMAIFARTLISAQNNWYVEAMNKRKLEEAQDTEGYKDDIIAAVVYYWPKVKAQVAFVIWTLVGVVFAMLVKDWSFVQAIYFAISAMSTGGFLSLDAAESPPWQLFCVAVYVIVGVPVMAIACGLLAHQVANTGRAEELEEKINAQVTEDELEMMTLLNIEDGDGCIDGTEFTILVLVRIGALNPDLIAVLYERFNDLDVKKEGKITYEDLQLQNEDAARDIGHGMARATKVYTRLGYG